MPIRGRRCPKSISLVVNRSIKRSPHIKVKKNISADLAIGSIPFKTAYDTHTVPVNIMKRIGVSVKICVLIKSTASRKFRAAPIMKYRMYQAATRLPAHLPRTVREISIKELPGNLWHSVYISDNVRMPIGSPASTDIQPEVPAEEATTVGRVKRLSPTTT
ncbi:hypothetical protein D3C75_997250 [compost metagenome]